MKKILVICFSFIVIFSNHVQASTLNLEGYLTELKQYRNGIVSGNIRTKNNGFRHIGENANQLSKLF